MSDADDLDEDKGNDRPGVPVDWRRIVRALLAGKLWLLVAAVLGGAIGLLLGKFAVVHSYESTASIRFEGLPGQTPIDAQRELPAMTSITHSEPILSELRSRMELGEASIDLMRRMVQVQADPGSGLVSFTTTGDSAERAAEMANTLVEVFLEHHRARRSEELTTEMASIEERLTAADASLAQARGTYDTFRETNQITDLSAEQEQAITQAAELRSQADLANAEIEALEARVRELRRALAATPRLQAVAVGEGSGQRRLRELETRLSAARGQGLGDDHPTVVSLQRQVDALESEGTGGTSTRMAVSSHHESLRTSLSEATTELEATRQRQESLEGLAVQAQERTNRFSTIEGAAANLLAQVNVAEALVAELNQQKAHIEDRLRDVQTGFRSVAEARPPESAVPSKKKYAVAAGIPAAFLLIMVSMLLFRELRGLKVQTPDEVAWWGKGPVIGTTRWPREPRALIDLIADMDDFAPNARGTMLVVGATDAERDLASEIARQLNHDWNSTTVIDMQVGAAGSGGVLAALPSGGEEPGDAMLALTSGDPISGEIHDGPTEIVMAHDDYLDGPTEISMGYGPPVPEATNHDPRETLVCTAWNGPAQGQALRRAARLADRVLVVVTSGAMRAPDLAQTKTRLGREGAVGYVLIGVSEAVARLEDRAGEVGDFWEPPA